MDSNSQVGSVINRGCDDIPFPIGAAINQDDVPSFLQSWCEWVDLRKGLRLH